MDSIQVSIHNNEHSDEIALIGVLTFDTTPDALDLIKKVLFDKNIRKSADNQIVINLSEITKSDSSGLALLSELMREVKRHNVNLKINNIPKKLMDLARLSGVESILPLDQNETL